MKTTEDIVNELVALRAQVKAVVVCDPSEALVTLGMQITQLRQEQFRQMAALSAQLTDLTNRLKPFLSLGPQDAAEAVVIRKRCFD